jgi:peptidoglycan recognition protein
MDLIRRDAWGARPNKGRPKDIAAPVRYLFLHHSAGPDGGPEVLRSIQQFHQNSRGWQDIAYTWLYSPRDRVFYEGRGPGVQGAHTRGYNNVGHGVCVLGNYEASKLPVHAIDDLAEWADWHGQTWGPAAYTAHRAVGQTACPGRNIMAVLDTINSIASGQPQGPAPEAPDDEDEQDDELVAWLTERVAPDYGTYEAWEDQVRRAKHDL